MSDALAGGFALDDFGGLEKLLDLFFGQRSVVSGTPSDREDDASENHQERSRQGPEIFLHGRCPPEIVLHCTPRARAETTPIAARKSFSADFSLLFSGAGLSSGNEI